MPDLSQTARQVALVDRTHRLIAAGFEGNRAYALARAGYDVIGWWPFGWQVGEFLRIPSLDRRLALVSP